MRSETAGFTLVEVLVVIAIIGLMTALALTRGGPVSPSVHARLTALTMASALKEARTQAIARNKSVAFTLDLSARRYQSGDLPVENLPSDLRLSLLTGQDQIVSDQTGRIRFDPDGTSTGGKITIEGGGIVWMVGVDWLSGHVAVETRNP